MNVWEQYRHEKRHLRPLLTTARVRIGNKSLMREKKRYSGKNIPILTNRNIKENCKTLFFLLCPTESGVDAGLGG